MDSSPMTHGAANSFLPKNESRTDMERVVLVVVLVVGAVAMVRRRALEDEVEKALAEPRVEARTSREWLT